MTDVILTLNAGSSSIKFAAFEQRAELDEKPLLSGQIDGIGEAPHLKAVDHAGRTLEDIDLPCQGDRAAQHHAALHFLVDWLHGHEAGWRVAAVGHRVVHGGAEYSRPMLLTDAVITALRALIPLAPLHQPHNLEGITALSSALPGLPQVACFDTAFHRSQSEVAQAYALPRRITDLGVRRYGFHGLSYEYIATILPRHLGRQAEARVVVAHLGNGASMCAMLAGRSIATTMGFTAIEGLMMGTRSGSLDPGILLFLMQSQGLDAAALSRLLYQESGLLGVSGLSQDMRTLLASSEPAARAAVDLYCYRIMRELGSLAAALGGLDALVLTAGIGEHASAVRARVCAVSAWLGMDLDTAANDANATKISTALSKVMVLVLPTNEEWIIARHTAELLVAPALQ